jgi:hypothetical protein
VHDRAPGADQTFIGARDQMLARLGQHLDGDVSRNEVFLDQLAQEIEIGLRGRGEADLDLLVANAAERLEHAQLALRPHRLYQRLVAVAQIDAAPDRRLVDDARGPSSVRQVDRLERSVLLDWVDTHLGIPLGRFRCCRSRRQIDRPPGSRLSPTTAAKSQPGTSTAECRLTPTDDAEGAQQNVRTQ